MQIGFIGLGHMGRPMAVNLIKANFDVCVYDVVEKSMSFFGENNRAENLLSLIKQSDVIITMVQTSQQVADLCLNDNGIFANAKENLLYLDCSSIDIQQTKTLHQIALSRQLAMLDAPVSGGVVGAENATLTFMVGGEKNHFEKSLPVLQKMGKKIIHAGVGGSGQAAKICNNLLLAISMIGVSEAFNLAEKLGLAADKFFEISSNSSGQCWSMTSYCPVPGILENAPSSHNYEPGFMAKMMLKDLILGQHAAEFANAMIPLGSLATELYKLYVGQGNAEKDFSGIINFLTQSKHSSH